MEPASLFGSAASRDALHVEAERYVARAITTMARARALVHADRMAALAVLTARRVALAEHLQRYQRFKHGRIFDPVIQHGTASSKIVARSMKVDCMELGNSFGAFHTRWLHARPAEWPSYRREMLATVDTITTHLRAELRAIGQLMTIADFYRS